MKMLVKAIQPEVRINVLTDISYRALVQGSTETSALLYLFENHHNVCITYLPKIHAKVYIADQSNAIIASANFTRGGGKINFEYGVKIHNRATIQKIQSDMDEYKNLGADITQSQLNAVHAQVEKIKALIKSEQKNIAKTIKLYSVEQQQEIENDLIRARIKNKSLSSIFSETLLYLLSRKPTKTQELNMLVSNIHPDLCDDTVDRVIDGERFGKLWKHHVRNAQQQLKKAGLIYRDEKTSLWHKAKK